MIAGLERLHDDRTGRGVAAVERALRPFQHLDLAHRALVLVERGGVGLEDAVDDQRDRAFRVAGAVDAADVDLRVARLRRARHDRHARCQLHEVGSAGDAGLSDHVARESGDRGGNIQRAFVDAAGGDDDVAGDVARIGRGRGRLGGGSLGGKRLRARAGDRQQDARGAAHQKRGCSVSHFIPLFDIRDTRPLVVVPNRGAMLPYEVRLLYTQMASIHIIRKSALVINPPHRGADLRGTRTPRRRDFAAPRSSAPRFRMACAVYTPPVSALWRESRLSGDAARQRYVRTRRRVCILRSNRARCALMPCHVQSQRPRL